MDLMGVLVVVIILTLKEFVSLIWSKIDLLESSNPDLAWGSHLNDWLVVESVSPRALCPWIVGLVSKGNLDWNGEVLIGVLWQLELLRRTASHSVVVENIGLNHGMVLVNSELASSIWCNVISESLSSD